MHITKVKTTQTCRNAIRNFDTGAKITSKLWQVKGFLTKFCLYNNKTYSHYTQISHSWFLLTFSKKNMLIVYHFCRPGIPMGNQNMLKTAIFSLRGWITGKRLKVEGYMLRGVLQALNPFLIRETFTKTGNQNVLKEAIFAPVRLSHAGIAEQGNENIHLFYL